MTIEVGAIRARWPYVNTLLSADAGQEMLAWCEAHRVDYVMGAARNRRLVAEIAVEMIWA